jgi:hypothetical protein
MGAVLQCRGRERHGCGRLRVLSCAAREPRTVPPRALKHHAVQWLLLRLSTAAPSLTGRCRLRGDVEQPWSHQGDGGKPGRPLQGVKTALAFPVHRGKSRRGLCSRRPAFFRLLVRALALVVTNGGRRTWLCWTAVRGLRFWYRQRRRKVRRPFVSVWKPTTLHRPYGHRYRAPRSSTCRWQTRLTIVNMLETCSGEGLAPRRRTAKPLAVNDPACLPLDECPEGRPGIGV